MDITIDIEQAGQACTILAVSGEVDVYTAPRLRESLVEAVSDGATRIVVNLDGVEFLDSTGIGVLVGGLKRVRIHDGELALVCTQQRLLNVFELTRLDTIFSIFPTVEEARIALVKP